MLKRFGYVLRCNCGEPFSVWTTKRRGQFLHSKNAGGCGKRPRADFTGGGSASVISGPYEHRYEADNAIHKLNNRKEQPSFRGHRRRVIGCMKLKISIDFLCDNDECAVDKYSREITDTKKVIIIRTQCPACKNKTLGVVVNGEQVEETVVIDE